MMLKVDELSNTAKKKFASLIAQKVEWVSSTKCWTQNIKGILKDINEIITAGNRLRVTEGAVLSTEEIAELVSDLTTLRALEMNDEARAHLVVVLTAHDVDEEIFSKTAAA
ncbi:MAG: hypothetical protein WC924_05825 [Candidatus Gracilibacteria bacterium]